MRSLRIQTNFIPANIQYEYDPHNFATKKTTKRFHESNSKTYA